MYEEPLPCLDDRRSCLRPRCSRAAGHCDRPGAEAGAEELRARADPGLFKRRALPRGSACRGSARRIGGASGHSTADERAEEHLVFKKHDGIVSPGRRGYIIKPEQYSGDNLNDDEQGGHSAQSKGAVEPECRITYFCRVKVEEEGTQASGFRLGIKVKKNSERLDVECLCLSLFTVDFAEEK